MDFGIKKQSFAPLDGAVAPNPKTAIQNPKSRNARPPRVLFFTRILPQPGQNGSGAYAADLLDYLQRHGCSIRVAWTQTPDRYRYDFYNTLPDGSAPHFDRFDIRPKDCQRLGPHLFNPGAIWYPRKARALYYTKRLLQKLHLHHPPLASDNPPSAIRNPQSPAWSTPCTPAERQFLYAHAADFKPDILIANYPWMLDGVEKKHTAPRHWTLTNDYRFRRCIITPDGRFTQNLIDPEGRATEQRQLANTDLIIAIQPNEAAAYAHLHPRKTILTATMSVREIPLPPAPDTPLCAFIASNNTVNRDAARWLLEHVWPKILDAHPAARLRIAGRICDALAPLKHHQRPRVELLGPIPDLATYYAGITLALVPLLEGSGIKTKLVEAIAHRRAAVTTSVGLDGLEPLAPALAIADTPATFAAAAIKLLSSPAARALAADHALSIARHHLSPDACYHELLAHARAAAPA